MRAISPRQNGMDAQERETMTAKPMTKSQLVTAIADELGSDKKTAAAALDALAAVVTREVSNGGAVTLPGIGKVFSRDRPARTVLNPATGEQINKPADKVVKMNVAKALKDSVNT
jgi:DNA-binding protein HU-beta